jgi:transposase
MVGRGEVTDKAWEQIAPLLPENGGRGGQWQDHRRVVNGILWKLRTAAPWRDLPSRYGPWQTCYERFVRWRRDGTWDRLLSQAQTKSEAAGEVEWLVSVDRALSCGLSSMPLEHVESRAGPTEKGGSASGG